MTEPQTPAASLDALFDAPTLYLREIDFARREALFLRMSRDGYARSSFLDKRTITVDGNVYGVPLASLLDRFREARPASRRINYIFHTAFCGSTLLSRCLDRPGVCLAYKEPFVLHQLCFVRRQDPRPDAGTLPTPFLDLALALLGRSYSADEIPLVKPADSCINLAREMLAAHPASAGVLLYARLDAFLVSMLKNPRRRRYVRGMVERAHTDLAAAGRLPDFDAEALSDAQAAAFVWVGLMRPYLDVLADERLRVRSLEASVFFDHPTPTLEAAARLFGLALTEDDIRAAVDGVFTRKAKDPSRTFDKTAYAAQNQRLAQRLTDEIEDGIAWIAAFTHNDPIPDTLPRPLVDFGF